MILDSSALVAVVLAEPGHESLLAKIKTSRNVGIGAPTLVESLIVLLRRLGGDPTPVLSDLLRAFEAEVIPFAEGHCREALRAYTRFGKGRHPAALNFGDCLSYAMASAADEPLLYVGGDFAQTDIQPA
jgi:ribonuclease VapC